MGSKLSYLEFLSNLSEDRFLRAVLSSPFHVGPIKKITIKSVIVNTKRLFQVSEQIEEKIFHKNMSFKDTISLLEDKNVYFKNMLFSTEDFEYTLFNRKDGTTTILKKAPSALKIYDHNRPKNKILQEGVPLPFLIELGVMDLNGKVKSSMRDKLNQVNHFLEMIKSTLLHLPKEEKIYIIDYGCGSALLTFSLYYFLREYLKLDVLMYGYDLKQDVICKCQALAQKVHFEHLFFQVQNIHNHEFKEKIAMIISLHACDIATDAVIAKGIRGEVPIILAVPCCQKEIMQQIENPLLRPLLKHGILKEKLASLVTDAARAQLLSMHGYHTEVMEFIDMEHTPKNVMIRAIKHHQKIPKQVFEDYEAFKKSFSISPYLEKLLSL